VVAVAAAIAAALDGSGIAENVAVKVSRSPSPWSRCIPIHHRGWSTTTTSASSCTATTYPGDSYGLFMQIQNHTGVDQSHRITLDLPDGFRLSGDANAQGADISVIQEGPSSFVITVAKDVVSLLAVQVEVLPQVAPGWYTISGATEPLETDLNNVG